MTDLELAFSETKEVSNDELAFRFTNWIAKYDV